MRLKFAIIISVFIHLALILLLAAGVFLRGRDDAAGPGDAVSVWIEAGEGATPSAQSTARQMSLPRSSDSMTSQSEDLSDRRKETPASTGSANGAGSGAASDGAGIAGSVGAGGNPVLAKIWRKIDRSKYYPSAARRRGIAGAPSVTFALNEDGGVKWLKLARSSGEAVLDDAALATVKRAEPLPYYPGPITLAVKYSLGE
ncbi:MAG: energy transducer TonB [bacterium]